MTSPTVGHAYVIVNVVTGYVMDILNAKTDNNTPVYSNTPGFGWNQIFTVGKTDDPTRFALLSGPGGQKSLALTTLSNDKAKLVVTKASNEYTSSQKWDIRSIPSQGKPQQYQLVSDEFPDRGPLITEWNKQVQIYTDTINTDNPTANDSWVLIPCV